MEPDEEEMLVYEFWAKLNPEKASPVDPNEEEGVPGAPATKIKN